MSGMILPTLGKDAHTTLPVPSHAYFSRQCICLRVENLMEHVRRGKRECYHGNGPVGDYCCATVPYSVKLHRSSRVSYIGKKIDFPLVARYKFCCVLCFISLVVFSVSKFGKYSSEPSPDIGYVYCVRSLSDW